MKLYKSSELHTLKAPLTFSKIIDGKMSGLYQLTLTYSDGSWEYIDLVPPFHVDEIDSIHYARDRPILSNGDLDTDLVVVWDEYSLGCLEVPVRMSQDAIKRSGVDHILK